MLPLRVFRVSAPSGALLARSARTRGSCAGAAGPRDFVAACTDDQHNGKNIRSKLSGSGGFRVSGIHFDRNGRRYTGSTELRPLSSCGWPRALPLRFNSDSAVATVSSLTSPPRGTSHHT